MHVDFRALQGADEIETLLRLETAAHSHPWHQRVFQDMVASPRAGFFLAECDSDCVGFACVQQAGDEATLLDIVVSPEYQGQGVGRQLLNYLIDRLREGGNAETFFLEVRASNFPAIALYLSCGFVEVGERRDYYPRSGGGREDALIMALPLKVEGQA
jgi:ribosomal-protein-alanine N-acetyltransferase